MSRPKNNHCATDHYDVGMLIDGRLRLIEFLGSGGMACVYRAQEEGTPHQYAVKFLKAEFHNEPYLMKFFNDEADNMRQLGHPNIVRFFRFVQEPDYSYIVMDYVDGFSLSDIIKKMYKEGQEIPIPEVVRMMTQVARALDAMHREGFVHRDIKPSNVLIERQTGQTFLSDLGITTRSNIRIEGAGTIAYMPPEISQTWRADHRADVYSFGIMFFEMLAKRRPYMPLPGMRGEIGENEITRQHLEAPIPDITSFRPDLPPELNALMRKALAKKPEDRFDSILEFARQVHGVLTPYLPDDMLDFATITHRRITPPDQQPEPPERTARAGFFAVLALLGVFIILVGVLIATNALPNSFGVGGGVTTAEASEAVTHEADNDAAVAAATERAATRTPQAAPTDPEPSPTPPNTDTPPTEAANTALRDADAVITPTLNRPPDAGVALATEPTYVLAEGAALMGLAEDDPLRLALDVDSPLHYLAVGAVEGFELRWELAGSAGVDAYGVALRVQDEANYVRLRLPTAAGPWQLEAVQAGEPTLLETGMAPAAYQQVRVRSVGDRVEVAFDDQIVRLTTQAFAAGGAVAWWLEGTADATLRFEALSMSLVGEEAIAAATASPTPFAVATADFSPLIAIVTTLVATNDIINSTIDCPRYIAQYDALEAVRNSPNAAMREMAQAIADAGQVVYARCRAESPDAPLTFVGAIQDYIDWEAAINAIAAELGVD